MRDDFLAAVGLTAADQPLLVDERDMDLQTAIDTFTLRHHAAEAVVRLYHSLAVAKARRSGRTSSTAHDRRWGWCKRCAPI